MRTKAALIALIVAAIALAAGALVADRTLGPPQLEKVRSVCPECHGEVPEYDRVARVHDRHAVFACSFCHRDQTGLKDADDLRAGLGRIGLGAMLLALVGITANIVVIRRRGSGN